MVICQHYLTWDNIMKMNRRRLKEFNQSIFDIGEQKTIPIEKTQRMDEKV